MFCAVQQQPVEEILTQLAYKDSRIIELDSEIQQLHQTIIDLREYVSEKDEVIRARDRAVQIMRAAQTEAESNTDQEREGLPATTQTDGEVVLILQRQLQEANELVVAREKSLQLLTEELNARNQHIAELSLHEPVPENIFLLSLYPYGYFP